MKKQYLLSNISIYFLLICSSSIMAQHKLVNSNKYISDFNFKENKGQLANPDGTLNSEVKFYSMNGGVNVYCKPAMISFIFFKVELDKTIGDKIDNLNRNHAKDEGENKSQITTDRADLILKGGNNYAEIVATEQQEYYENHFNAFTPEEGISNVKTFKTITYKNIYPNIDLILHSQKEGVKYEFLVKPNGKVEDIQLTWEGLQNIKTLENGGIHYTNTLGSFEETKPISYQEGIEIGSNFKLDGTDIAFKINEYDKTKPLIIDPTLSWATYYGGSNKENPVCAKTDDSGNIFIIGYTLSSNGIATTGTHQNSFGGNQDVFMAKFDTKGSLKWATYYGGSDYEEAGWLTFDDSSNIYLTGLSLSSNGIATTGAFQTTLASYHYDAFLAKFNYKGVRIWATYYGGPDTENSYGVGLDSLKNIYISGNTNSTSGIATTGAYQTTSGGYYDGFIVKFSNNGSRQWATYFGGSGFENCGIKINKENKIFIQGGTASTSGISTKGAYQSSYGGGSYDGFLAKFETSGSIIWSTYFGGSDWDVFNDFIFDSDNNIYLTGDTYSTSGIATSDASQRYCAGKRDAMFVKFNSNGSLLYSTYFGGYNFEIGNSLIQYDSISFVISGSTTSATGMSTPGAYQRNFGGNVDAFLVEFKKKEHKYWSSYYGGTGTETGISLCADKFSNVYLLTSSSSSSGLVTKGAYQTTYGGGIDNILAKFNFKPLLNDVGIDSISHSKDTICSSVFPVKVKLRNWGAKDLDSVMIGWSVNNIIQKPFKWSGRLKLYNTTDVTIGSYFLFAVKYTIKAWTYKPNGVLDSLSGNDTLSINLFCLDAPKANVGKNTKICLGQYTPIGAGPVSGNTYLWSSKPSGYKSIQSKNSVNPKITTTYYLTEKLLATGCTKTDSITITVNPIPNPNAGRDTSVCSGKSLSIGADTALKGHTYSWVSSPSGFNSNLVKTKISPTLDAIYILTDTITATGCSKSDSIIISILPSPNANVGSDTGICFGSSIVIGSSPVSGNTYLWSSLPSGYSSTSASQKVSPTTNTTYILTEILTSNGCSKSDSITVNVNPLPNTFLGSDTSICEGSSISIGSKSVSGNGYSWKSLPSGFASSIANPKVSPSAFISYILLETIVSTNCKKSDTISITVNKLPMVNAGSDTSICKGDSVLIGSMAANGNSYSWKSLPGGFNSSSAKIKVAPTVSTIFDLTQTISATGCKKSDSVKIAVLPLPTSHWKIIANGKLISYFAMDTTLSPSVYDWDLGDGNNAKGYNIKHVYTKNGSYKIKLIVTGKNGCNNEFDSTINVIVSGLKPIQIGNQNFYVYPNPTDHLITIESNHTLNNSPFTITDQTGRRILIGELNSKINTVDISTLASGFYFLQIGEANKETFKILKQ